MKVFISQPMRGKSRDEVEAERAKAVAIITAAGHEVADTVFDYEPTPTDELKCPPLWYLAKALKVLATCDAAVFLPQWEDARGCRIECACCAAYGIRAIPLSSLDTLEAVLK